MTGAGRGMGVIHIAEVLAGGADDGRVDPRTGVKVLAVMEAIEQAARTGQRIRLSES